MKTPLSEVFLMLRIASGLSTTEFSQQIGISSQYLNEIENGLKKPTLRLIEKYSKALKIKKSDIFFFEEEAIANNYSFQESLFMILKKITGNNT